LLELERSVVFSSEYSALVSQSKELCRDFIHSRILREELSWSKVVSDLHDPHGALVDVSVVLLKLGDELECMRPYVYRNIAKQLNISVAVEAVVSDAFLSVATEILGSHGARWWPSIAAGLAVDCVRQGHPVMVHTIVDSLGEFVEGTWSHACQMLYFHPSFKGDILKCVVNMDSRARAHWLSTAVFTWRQFLKTMFIYLTKTV
uniref:Bcl-2 Bcl-2 homology region 1-3 domain-containing protein n=1 Tax=Sinocyclocheilus anshuiensis TaxID=1608454 RepID=A0A671LX47_9TELE